MPYCGKLLVLCNPLLQDLAVKTLLVQAVFKLINLGCKFEAGSLVPISIQTCLLMLSAGHTELLTEQSDDFV